MRHRITPLKSWLPLGVLLAMLSVSFLPTLTPSACAAGMMPGMFIDNPGGGPGKGGPDDPDDGTGNPKAHSVIRPVAPTLGTSTSGLPHSARAMQAGDRAAVQSHGPSSWLEALRMFVVQALWRVG